MANEHEENIKKEFAAAEGITVEATETPKEVVKELGKVDVTRQMDHTSPDDPEIKRLNSMVGYTALNLKECNLPLNLTFLFLDHQVKYDPFVY